VRGSGPVGEVKWFGGVHSRYLKEEVERCNDSFARGLGQYTVFRDWNFWILPGLKPLNTYVYLLKV